MLHLRLQHETKHVNRGLSLLPPGVLFRDLTIHYEKYSKGGNKNRIASMIMTPVLLAISVLRPKDSTVGIGTG
jgi:hypothetical protein